MSKFQYHTHSYLALRKAVGIIGMSLPFTLMITNIWLFGNEGTEDSISDYYYTDMRDLFVGSLCAMALFMFFYSGFDKIDDWTGDIAGICVLGVAFFPTTKEDPINTIGIVHYVFAVSFFLTLSFFSIKLFTKMGPNPTSRKLARNKVYYTCGVIILLSLLTIGLNKAFGGDNEIVTLTFWGETVALVAFGISWLTKGEGLLADPQQIPPKIYKTP